ncbi:MAG: Do family serine endopeptidase [Betaproteobacteria bacterium]|nr:Do family serine endopeptidase [Betaproteobacteria bacterium]
MRRLWLIFAQAVTVSVAALFVVSTLKPEWLTHPRPVVQTQEVAPALPVAAADARKAVSYSDGARRALPAVVHVFTSKEIRSPRHPLMDDPVFRHFFGDRRGDMPQRASGLGSGVIVTPDGYILTNNHVVEAADDIEVALNDGRKFKARTVGVDPESDLAILRIQSDARLPAITFASADNSRVGDVVLAIGNPFGVGQTVTMGIISALGRSHLGINTFEDFIQTDAAINPGNSGGALVDSAGNLIGINTAIYSQSGGSLGIGFAIPVSLARSIMDQIIQTGTVTRGWIGVAPQEITPELAESYRLPATEGVVIAYVEPGGPANRAGIRVGDVLVSVQQKAIRDERQLIDTIAALPPGNRAAVHIVRCKEQLDIQVEIGRRPTVSAAEAARRGR